MASEISNFFLDNDDLLFQFKNGLKWEEIVELTEAGYSYPDGHKNLAEALAFYEEVLKAAGEFVAREVAPRAQKIDRSHPKLVDGEVVLPEELRAIYQGLADLGLFGLAVPRTLGGSHCPLSVYMICNEIIARGDSSVMGHFGFHGGIAAAMMMYTVKEGSAVFEDGRFLRGRFDDAIREIASGQNHGCMVLTEPGAGSDLGAIRTKAVQRDGRWYLTGEKIFITSGDGQYQFVLAKSEPEKHGEELKALSLFMVPRYVERDGKRVRNVEVTKVEEKLGHHGSAAVSLLYEDSVGELVGERGQGFEYMLALMNSARIGVGLESIGNAEAAYRQARAYASERVAMGRAIENHELIAEKLLDMETWLAALRALAFDALNAADVSAQMEMQGKAKNLEGEELAKWKSRHAKVARRARRLTPLLKYTATEKGVQICRDAIQIMGGIGYIDETGVHKYLRDALVTPIYEGTSQIQSLMATKDHLLWATRDPAGFLRRAARARLLARTANTSLAKEVYRADAYVHRVTETLLLRIFGRKLRNEFQRGLKGKDPSAWGRYLTRDFMRSWDVRADFSHGLLHAERLTQMLSDVAIGKVLSAQAERFPERRKLAERFIHKMALRIDAVGREIEAGDESVLEAIAERQKKAQTA